MPNQRENVIRYINLIINKLPSLISLYTSEEQTILLEFIKSFKKIERAQYDRNGLAKDFEIIRNLVINSKEYLSVPFFWFLDSYLENAIATLDISSFHADVFFDYLLYGLKGSSGQTKGMFHLLQQHTPFNDLLWEELQYECSKLRIPLKEYQVDIIQFVYKLLESSPDQLLKKGKLKNFILQAFNRPKLTGELSKLFRLLNAKWNVWPNYHFFGIELFWIHLKIPPVDSFNKFIDLNDEKNQILTTSWIYSVRGRKNEYIGLFFVPSGLETNLKIYLDHKTKNKEIINYQLFKIISNQWSYSFSRYRSEFGWQELKISEWKQIATVLKLSKDPKRKKTPALTYLSPRLKDRSYLELKDPYESVKLISHPRLYSYNDLLSEILKITEFNLLQSLTRQGAILIDFFPSRLGDEYSLDSYWLKLPKLSYYQLTRFLELLPSAYIAYTEDEIFLRARLSKEMVQRIKSDLQWLIYQIIPSHQPLTRNITMYDQNQKEWKKPLVLAF